MDIILLFLAKPLDKRGTTLVHITYPSLDELYTILVEVECTVNSRPLTYVSTDDLEVITLTLWSSYSVITGSHP